MIKLSDIYTKEEGVNNYFSYSTIDTIFYKVSDAGIREVLVTKEEMRIIVKYIIANVGQSGGKEAWNAMKTGRISKLLGVGLKLLK